MKTISYDVDQEKLVATMDAVIVDHAPVVITRSGALPVVMLSLEDYESMEETAYLMSNPANACRLLESIQALERGQGIVREAALLGL